MQSPVQSPSANVQAQDRLDSWKDIAAYLQREVRTVQLWEKNEGLPVHRHTHRKRGTVYAYKSEVDAWWKSRRVVLQPQPSALKPALRRSGIVAGIAGALVLCVAVWLAMSRRLQAPTAEPAILPLTSDPGSEITASFSPDGNQVAFAWKREGREDYDIYVKVVGSDKPLQLTNTPEWDVAPAWSPDGREIAFNRSRREGGNGIYIVSPLGGLERLITEMDEHGSASFWPASRFTTQHLSWSADGKWLAHEGISLISPASGEKRRLTTPPTGVWDGYPAFSRDGQLLAFVRVSPNAHDLYVVSATGGEPKLVLSQAQVIFGLCWTVDSREIVYSSAKSEWDEAGLWRVSVSGGPARRLTEGSEQAWAPSISPQGTRLAFPRRTSDLNIWAVLVPGNDGPQEPARRLIASTRMDGSPVFSPDGTKIAFTSSRTGTAQIWVCDRDGSNATPLTSFPGPGAELPNWSPDGRQIAFDSSARGNIDVYVIAAHGGAPRQLTAESTSEAAPNWSRDGRWVYFASDRTGRFEIWKIPAEGGTSVQVTTNGGYRPITSAAGEFLYYERPPRKEFDAWKVSVEGEETPVLRNLRTRWTLAENGLYFFSQEHGDKLGHTWFITFFDFATGRKKLLAPLGGTPLAGQRPAVSPDGRTFLYTQWDVGEADLMLVENFR
jgi:Tol biopolymer transport system component